jgi:hypothetical protein
MRYSKVVTIWLILAGLMVCNGIFRVAVLIPAVGNAIAQVVSVALGIIIVLAGTRPFLSGQPRMTRRQVLNVSVSWLTLTVAFELLVGWATGRSWPDLLAAYAIWNGALWPLVLMAVVLAPIVWLPRAETPTNGRIAG